MLGSAPCLAPDSARDCFVLCSLEQLTCVLTSNYWSLPLPALKLTRSTQLPAVSAQSLQSCLTLRNPLDCQAPLSTGFSRQEYWSELPCPNPGDFPDLGIEPTSLMPPALQVDSLPLSCWGSSRIWYMCMYMCVCVYIYVNSRVLLSHNKRRKFCHLQQHGWT